MDQRRNSRHSSNMTSAEEASNTSVVHSSDGSGKNTAPSSTLLQDLIREKKAQTQQQSRMYDSDSGNPDRRDGLRSEQIAQGRRSSVVNNRAVSGSKEMGVRETDEYIESLIKQNFDLKLELWQRRQRAEALEKKMERIEAVERMNEELLKTNQDLRNEIAKRDQAIQEAVVMICELEEKMTQLERVIIGTRPDFLQRGQSTVQSQASALASVPALSTSKTGFNNQMSSTMTTTPDLDTVEAEILQRHTGSEPARKVAYRQPSFLRENQPSTSALRSLFTEDGALSEKLSSMTLHRPRSLFSGYDDEDPAERDPHLDLRSPALSVLSKSSFVSVYGKKELSSPHVHSDDSQLTEILPGTSKDAPQRPTDPRSARVRQWLDDRAAPPTPTAAPRTTNSDVIPSINQILQDTSLPVHKLATKSAGEQAILDHISAHQMEQQRKRSRSPAFGGPMFDDSPLPPTPDTLYTYASQPVGTASTGSRSKDYLPENRSAVTPDSTSYHQAGYESNRDRQGLGGGTCVSLEQFSVLAEGTDSEEGLTAQEFIPKTGKASHSLLRDTISKPSQNLYATNLMFDGTETIPMRPNYYSRQSSQHLSHKSRTPDSSHQDLSKVSPQEWLDAAAQTTILRREIDYNENRDPVSQHYQQLVTPPRIRSEKPRQRREQSAFSTPSEPSDSPQKQTTQDEPQLRNERPLKLTRVRSSSFGDTTVYDTPSKSAGTISTTPSRLSASKHNPNSFKAPLYPPRRYSSTGRGQSQTRPSSSADHYSPQDQPSSYSSPADGLSLTHKSSARRGRHVAHVFDDGGMTSGEEGMMTPESTFGVNTASNSDLGYRSLGSGGGSRGQLRSESGTSLPRPGLASSESYPVPIQQRQNVSRNASEHTTRPASAAGMSSAMTGSGSGGRDADTRRFSQVLSSSTTMPMSGTGSFGADGEVPGGPAVAGTGVEKDTQKDKGVSRKWFGKMGSVRIKDGFGFRRGSRDQGGSGGPSAM
ncbi:MAG: hypothetical protein MMC33_005504 [Icmadophila ericetorum]|nr:hypothetical protein [Icmadophila ericetorum]